MPTGSTVGAAGLLALSGVLGTAGVIAQTMPGAGEETLITKFGSMGLIAVGAWFLVRYFMAVIERKDSYIERTQKEHTEMLVSELKAAGVSREQLTVALRDLTEMVRSTKG
jgi:hypothetical protein